MRAIWFMLIALGSSEKISLKPSPKYPSTIDQVVIAVTTTSAKADHKDLFSITIFVITFSSKSLMMSNFVHHLFFFRVY